MWSVACFATGCPASAAITCLDRGKKSQAIRSPAANDTRQRFAKKITSAFGMLKRKTDANQPAPTQPPDAVREARTRARRRLIGAAVLLVVGIIAFPLVFESQPRPIPVDVPIEIPRKESAAPLGMPAERPVRPSVTDREERRSASASTDKLAAASQPARGSGADRAVAPERRGDGIITESRREAGREVPPGPAASAPGKGVARAAASPASHPAADPKGKSSAEPRSGVPRVEPADDGARARALLEGHQDPSAEASRFVVQVGAFAGPESARETRQRIEKLGLKTYTQVAPSASGSRIRVRLGPFATREEADAALAKARAAGVGGVVLTL